MIDNKGFISIRNLGCFISFIVFISTIIYAIGYMGYYYYLYPPQISEEKMEQKQNIELTYLGNTAIVKDYKNNYSVEIDTLEAFSFPEVGRELSKVEKSLSFDDKTEPDTFSLSYTPEQYIVLGEGFENFYIKSTNGKFDPKVYWRDFLINKDLKFVYKELEINGYKAYTTAKEPGIGLSVKTIIIINENHYLEIFFAPYMADPSEFEKPFYNLKNSNVPLIQNYFDIVNSVKPIKK